MLLLRPFPGCQLFPTIRVVNALPIATFKTGIVDDIIASLNRFFKSFKAYPVKFSCVLDVVVLDVLGMKVVLYYVPVLVSLFALVFCEINPLQHVPVSNLMIDKVVEGCVPILNGWRQSLL